MKVLTIDFDIIMQPSINFYNDIISMNKPLKNYLEEFSYVANVPADLWIYEYLTKYIYREYNNNVPIKFIESHEQIVDLVKEYDNLDITNIDHHHDCGYEEKGLLLPKADVGNWVRYLREKKKLNSYTWVKNENSINELPKVPKYIDNEINLRDYNLEQEEFDMIIICASYEWVPPLYHPLFMVWQDIVN